MIDLVTYNERLVHAVSDAIFYENISADGILYGMGYESSGNKVTIFSGYGIIKGRVFEITGQEEVNIPQVTSGSVNGQIIIQIDLSNSDNPIQLIADNTMRELTQNPQFNYLAGVWEVQLATYSVTPIGVVNIDRVFNKIQGDEYVLSQLQSLTETVTNQGTRINNQANRLTTLESMFPYVAVDTQTVTVPKNKPSIGISTSATKDTIDGQTGQWKFSHWGPSASYGWVGASYIANVKANSTTLWIVGGARTVDSKVRIYAIYVKSPKW